MTTREHLEAARDWIRDEKAWCQGTLYGNIRDRKHSPVCLMGALKCTMPRPDYVRYDQVEAAAATQALATLVGGDTHGLPDFNDEHTHVEVLELFNLAIADEIAKEDAAHRRHMTEEQQRELAEDPAAPLVFA